MWQGPALGCLYAFPSQVSGWHRGGFRLRCDTGPLGTTSAGFPGGPSPGAVPGTQEGNQAMSRGPSCQHSTVGTSPKGADRSPAKVRSQRPLCGQALRLPVQASLTPRAPAVLPIPRGCNAHCPGLVFTFMGRVPPDKGSFWW